MYTRKEPELEQTGESVSRSVYVTFTAASAGGILAGTLGGFMQTQRGGSEIRNKAGGCSRFVLYHMFLHVIYSSVRAFLMQMYV